MKFRKIKRVLLITLLIGCILPQAVFSQESGTQTGTSFLWQVQSDTATVYVLGSIHILKPEIYPLNPTIESAFDQSDFLVVEVNPLTVDQTKMQNEIVMKGMYQGNKTVKDDLSDEVFIMLTQHCESMNIPVENLLKFKPGMIVMTLANVQLMKLGFSPEYGIDMHFVKKAKGQKPILELETMDEQLSLLFDGLLDDDLILKNSILEWEKTKDTMDTVISLWKNGNAGRMNALIIEEPLQEHPELLPVYQKMFFQRNEKMTGKIKNFLETEHTYFVVVGSGHLIGDEGIIHLLKQEGYSVKQL